MSDPEKVVAELRAKIEVFKRCYDETPNVRELLTAIDAVADLIAHQAVRLEEVTRERDEARANASDTTWFWRIVDAQGLNDVSSDEVVALRELTEGFTALTAAEAEKERYRAAIEWALGEGDSDFGDNNPENAKPFWWRPELRRRAALSEKEQGA